MSRRYLLFGVFLACMLITSLAHAVDPATPDEAKALAVKAAAHMAAVGPDKAIIDFMDPAAGFIDRELFVVVYGPDNTILCGYGVKVLNGRDATTLKDVEGKEFGKDIIALAKSQGSGWVDYRMTNPLTKKVGPKTSWVIRVGDYILFVGAFKS
jgi:hypothetical protein